MDKENFYENYAASFLGHERPKRPRIKRKYAISLNELKERENEIERKNKEGDKPND